MNREIKFRAWDKEENEMIYDVQDTYDYKCNGDGAHEESFGQVLRDKTYEVMQYVGKDKEKNDIYEGDIVEYEIQCYGKQIGIVRWSDKHCGFIFGDLQRRNKVLVTKTSANKIKVIGNIYESGELL